MVIIHKKIVNTGFVNGLTIDFNTSRIFWCDAKDKGNIWSANLDGSGYGIVKRSVDHIFAIASFGSYLFWTEWNHNAIYYGSKTGNDSVLLQAFPKIRDVQNVFGLKIYTKLKQQGEYGFIKVLFHFYLVDASDFVSLFF